MGSARSLNPRPGSPQSIDSSDPVEANQFSHPELPNASRIAGQYYRDGKQDAGEQHPAISEGTDVEDTILKPGAGDEEVMNAARSLLGFVNCVDAEEYRKKAKKRKARDLPKARGSRKRARVG